MEDTQDLAPVGAPRIEVNFRIEILPTDQFSFSDTLLLNMDLGAEFLPRDEETEFYFPRSTEASRLMYKDLSSIH